MQLERGVEIVRCELRRGPVGEAARMDANPHSEVVRFWRMHLPVGRLRIRDTAAVLGGFRVDKPVTSESDG